MVILFNMKPRLCQRVVSPQAGCVGSSRSLEADVAAVEVGRCGNDNTRPRGHDVTRGGFFFSFYSALLHLRTHLL